MNQTPSLELIFGPMFSGKTTELIRRLRRYHAAEKRCLTIKFYLDKRYGDESEISTHDQQKMTAAASVRTLFELDYEKLKDKYEVFGIDEGQFFPDIVPFCQKALADGKIIIVAALDGTFERKPFGSVNQLLPLATKFEKLNAICFHCKLDAPFTRRIGEEKEIQLIGGKEKYIASCANCFEKKF